MIKIFTVLMILSITNIVKAEDCTKKILVKVKEERLKFNIFSASPSETVYYKDHVLVSCDMWKNIRVGDKLKGETERDTTDTAMPFPMLKKKEYTVLEK